ncbi:MAG: N-acetylmuramoyl-L-alanine amidase [Prevotella sp.]|nr:N-acetylmuramoyl-L-alanine amidase [Prevotella sp.]
MSKRLLTLLFLSALAVVTTVAASKKFVLVIDAGHGGHDTGAIGALTKEKTINLNVALAFGRLVERNCPDVKVIYTRKTDVFVPLHTRADIANSAKADLFVSVHTNSLPKGRVARGVETYTLGMHRAADNLDVAKRENSVILIEKDYKQRYQGFDPNSSESYIMFEFIQDHNMAHSVDLAKAVQKHVCARSGQQDKGVKQAGFLVLRETSMPSCLIELGFISTPDEEQFLNSPKGVERLGRGIYEAFVDYRKSQPGKTSAKSRAAVIEDVEYEPVEATAAAPVVTAAAQTITAEPAAPAVEPATPAATAEAPAPAIGAETIALVQPMALAQQPSMPTVEKQQQKPSAEPVADETVEPVFKVQILASGSRLKAGDAQLKGQRDADCYQDGGMYKYTVGASTNYNQIYQLRKTLLARFPQAFIIAFKNDQRTDVQQAIQEFKKNRK